MIKIFTVVICIATVLFASPAFAYKRDRGTSLTSEGEAAPQETTTEESKQAPQPEEYEYKPKGRGLRFAGYILSGVGGAAAIAGSTIIAVNRDKWVTGVIIGSAGSAVGLVGGLLILFGSDTGSYGLAPAVDPSHGTYGLAMSGRF